MSVAKRWLRGRYHISRLMGLRSNCGEGCIERLLGMLFLATVFACIGLFAYGVWWLQRTWHWNMSYKYHVEQMIDSRVKPLEKRIEKLENERNEDK